MPNAMGKEGRVGVGRANKKSGGGREVKVHILVHILKENLFAQRKCPKEESAKFTKGGV